jgi:outer membrane phospholipase A
VVLFSYPIEPFPAVGGKTYHRSAFLRRFRREEVHDPPPDFVPIRTYFNGEVSMTPAKHFALLLCILLCFLATKGVANPDPPAEPHNIGTVPPTGSPIQTPPPKESAGEKTDLRNPILAEPQKFEALEQQDDFRIFRHKPTYFAYSNPLTKVQLSFRSSLIETWPLFFGYTQVIFWELGKDSKPFLDATYNPEFFYRFQFSKQRLKSIDLGLWEHNSNGKGGEESRSFDQAYLKVNYVFEFKNWLLSTTTKLSYIYNDDKTNADILNYIGPLDLQVSFIQLYSGIIDKSVLSLTAHPGGKFANNWQHGGYEVSYSFRLGGVKVVPSFYLQYFRGFGETLLTYNKNEEQFRAGLQF